VATAGRAQLEDRTLVITGTAEDDTIALREGRRLEIDFGDDGVIDFEVGHRRFDRIEVESGGGADRLVIDPLDARVHEVHVDPGAADDRVIVNATDEQEQTLISAFGGAVFVLGPTFVQINGAEATDRLRLNGRGGDDLISTSTDAMRMALDGGTGTNVLLGGPGDDHLVGGADFDDIAGGRGDDVADMGPDFDRFTWRPGDGDDVVNGQGGRDSMFFGGSSHAEAFDLAADGRRLRFTRDVGNIVMDVDVEVVDSIALGGADSFTIGDLRRTAVEEVNANLGVGGPGGDGAADRVAATATAGDDAITVTGSATSGAVTVAGLPVKLGIAHAEGALNTLAIATLAGNDTVDSTGLETGTIQLAVD
jgi:Ca2+-binding RTX toxin-like protein